MTLGTTNVSFSSIQTEFGGTNPISLSAEYYKGGPYVPSGQATSATDGTAIPATTSTAIRVGMFRGLTKAAASPIRATSFSLIGAPVTATMGSSYDGSSSTVDTTTAGQLYIVQARGEGAIFTGFAGASSITRALNVRLSAQQTDSQADTLGNVAIDYSTNSGSTWTSLGIISSMLGVNVTSGPTTYTASITMVPTSLRVRITMTQTAGADPNADLTVNIYDVVLL